MANSAADPAYRAAAVTPSDSAEINARALYVGGAGNVALKCRANDTTLDDAVTFVAVPAGTFLPVSAAVVMSTNTTATSIVALY